VAVPRDVYDALTKVKGRWKDVVTRRRPDGTEEVVEETPWNSNMIVLGMSIALAALMKGDPNFAGGIKYHAVGRGLPAWDPLPTPPTPLVSAVSLVDEYFRKPPTAISYLDPLGNPVPGPTRSILVQTILDYTEANGMAGEYIREQGIFCGQATAALGSGTMVNLIYHVAKFKNASVKITRYINFQM
jgi:hypothetical protein